MQSTFLTRSAALLTVLSIAANLLALGIGSSRGLTPPNVVDFGNAADLVVLASSYHAHVLSLALSLLSPCLAIPIALGWFELLRGARAYALAGVALYFIGMIFVVLLDVLELVLVVDLAPAYARAGSSAQPALLGVGATLGHARDVLGYVGHFFSFGLAQIALGVAILLGGGAPRWLGWWSFVPGIVLGWLATGASIAGASVGPLAALGILSFLVWLVGMAVVLWRWRPVAADASRGRVHA
jgi:hypothetical protein